MIRANSCGSISIEFTQLLKPSFQVENMNPPFESN